jgi:hypothetical protein
MCWWNLQFIEIISMKYFLEYLTLNVLFHLLILLCIRRTMGYGRLMRNVVNIFFQLYQFKNMCEIQFWLRKIFLKYVWLSILIKKANLKISFFPFLLDSKCNFINLKMYINWNADFSITAFILFVNLEYIVTF